MNASRRFDVVAAAGFCCWVVLAALVRTDVLSVARPVVATLAVALATLVVVPLVARLADLPYRPGDRSSDRSGDHPRNRSRDRPSHRSRWYRLASLVSLPAALSAVASLVLPPGPVATALAVPWLFVTLSLAVFGLERGLPNLSRPAELAVSVALLYLPVAGAALVAHRAGVTLWFGPTTVLLTVVHFHYAGCALPAYAGLVARDADPTRRFRVLLGVVLVGPGIIGLGIAFSPAVEIAAASLFAVVVLAVALSTLASLRGRRAPGYALVGLAAVAVTVSMGFVVAYLITRETALSLLGFEAMLAGHGWLNAVGFALAGLVGWRLVDPASDAPPLGMPISRLTARGRVGADFLDRSGLSAPGEAGGMVDGFSVFDGPDCDAARVDAGVRAFYERTGAYALRIEPTWEPGFRHGARLYAAVARRVEQMNFPVDERDPSRLSSVIVPVDDRADGRANVRAWIRTYDATGAAIYLALYATHRLDGRPYMNIAFPLPLTNLTSVLRVEPLDVADPDGVCLSTRDVDDTKTGDVTPGDAGIYLRTPLAPLRIPMNESIRVWSDDMAAAFPADFPAGSGDADLFARHEVTLFGRRFLRLDYVIDELPAEVDGTGRAEGAKRPQGTGDSGSEAGGTESVESAGPSTGT